MTKQKEAETLKKELLKKTNVFINITGNNFEERHPIIGIRYMDVPNFLRVIAAKIEAKTTALTQQYVEIVTQLEFETELENSKN